MKRRFNTTGTCNPDLHYMIPAERRLPEAPALVDQMGYFVVHAPRQTGKTTALLSLAHQLTASGTYAAMLFSCQEGAAAGERYGAAQRAIIGQIQLRVEQFLPPALRPPPFVPQGDEGLLGGFLTTWARTCPRPLVLVFDEIDALQGASLISVLSQLRAGFTSRPTDFPASVILCGMRDVRDYKAVSGGDPNRLGTSSPFNVKVESLRMGDFTPDEVTELYAQHTQDTGQVFTEEALGRVVEVTAGQPWLVNALGREVVEKMAIPASKAITAAHIEQAKERLILARATHLDSLVSKLTEPRVKKIVEPVIAGTMEGPGDGYDDDLQYCRDLGILAQDNPIRITNPIYREVTVRVLSASVEAKVLAEPQSFVLSDGRLDMGRLLREFAEFWREHGEVLTAGLSYHEVAPQLVLMAFLQRIVNGGGFIDREYGIGRGRIDLLLRWPYPGADGKRAWQREALELKVWRDKQKDPIVKGLEQIDGYLNRMGLDTGVLVIFDRRSKAEDIETRTRFEDAATASGRKLTVLRG